MLVVSMHIGCSVALSPNLVSAENKHESITPPQMPVNQQIDFSVAINPPLPKNQHFKFASWKLAHGTLKTKYDGLSGSLRSA